MGVSVPKRIFKRAVDRNLLKRRVREAYRMQKPDFFKYLRENGVHARLVIQYRSREIESYQLIEEKLKEAMEKVKLRLVKGTNG